MRMYDIITNKKQGRELSDSEICYLVRGFVSGEIPDYQMSALLMAICLQGMTDRETYTLTSAMLSSGDTVDLSGLHNTADKHSTGGVGDKTTMVVAPLAAALGLTVAKMSGRGLGHTGGTIDKLESIPGYRTELSPAEFLGTASRCGIAVVGQSGNLVPADKKIYALRDVTATVDCLPLIASSIMSKKLASGAETIVLDVKVGSGALAATYEDGMALAQRMVAIGSSHGRRTAAVITDMSVPLGSAVGQICEVKEAIDTLKGGGSQDLREICLTLASTMLAASAGIEAKEARRRAEGKLADGSAFAAFCRWIEAQGGDVSYIDDPSRFPSPLCSATLTAPCDGYISAMDTAEIGMSAVTLGAGREKKTDTIDNTAGIEILKKTGDQVTAGEAVAHLFTSRPGVLHTALQRLSGAYGYSPLPTTRPPLIYGKVHNP